MLQIYLIIIGILLASYAVWIISTTIKSYKLPTIQLAEVEHKFSYCIVIPARNEAHNITQLLESIAVSIHNQKVEIIVIDDHSTDQTLDLCQKFFEKNPLGQVIALQDHTAHLTGINSYKKLAISIAIEHTQADWIIQTDADCVVPKNWMSVIENAVENHQADYITGPVRLISKDNQASSYFLHAFQALDFMTMQGITMAGYHRSKGLMSNGANLGYSKTSFQAVNGFDNIDQVASGDDMLLLDKITQKTSAHTVFLKNRSAIVDTEIVYSIRALIQQRIRWGSKSKYYKDLSLKIQLGAVYLINVLIFIMPLFSVIDLDFLKWTFIIIIIKSFIEYILVIPMATFFNQKQFLPIFIILQPIHILYIVSVGFMSLVSAYNWKDRTVK